MLNTTAKGQNYSQGAYSPPPMFEDMGTPMARPQSDTGNLVEPMSSAQPDMPSANPALPPVITPRVSVDPDAPKPTRPMMKPIVDERDIKRAPVSAPEKKTAPSSAPRPTQKPSAPTVDDRTVPTQKPAHKSATRGDVTMPAMAPVKVEAEKLKNEDTHGAPATVSTKEPTILERMQTPKSTTAKVEDIKPVVPRPNNPDAAVSFETGDVGKKDTTALLKMLPFEAGQIRLSQEDTDAIAAGVVKELDNPERKDWRVMIKSYATPHGTGVASDKRIALSRALSLRSSLIAQGVASSRIDLVAQPTDIGEPQAAQTDRIDLYLYGVKKKKLF